MLQSLDHDDSIEIYQFRIWIKGISPMIWRRILVSSSSSLADLHYAIQITMGWSDIHLHQFDIWGKGYGLCYGLWCTNKILDEFRLFLKNTYAAFLAFGMPSCAIRLRI